jgi:hypothetical protein
MSIPLLRELHNDVRRLVIAGAALAAEDNRLLKALPGLRRLGESAPVFSRVADEVAAVTEASQEHVAAKLLDLAALLHAILHTQGSTDAPGELKTAGAQASIMEGEARAIGFAQWPAIPFRKLKPVMDALTTRGSGRYEIIRQGFEDGLFADIRTYVPVVEALGDVYTEIADFVAESIIPSIGASVLPILRDRLSLTGGSGDAKRLSCICKLSGDEGEVSALIAQALQESSLAVKLAAIAAAAGKPAFEETLLEMSRDRKAEIREAALLALSALESDAAADRIVEAMLGKDVQLAIIPAQRCIHPSVASRLLQAGHEIHDSIRGGDKEPHTLGKLMSIIESLKLRADRPEMIDFFQRLLLESEYDRSSYKYMMEMTAELLLQSGIRDNLLFLHELRDRKQYVFGYSFEAALRLLAPADVYDSYENYLSNTKNQRGKQLLQKLNLYAPDPMRDWARGTVNPIREWDKRWAERLLVSDEQELVCRFAVEPTREMIQYLLKSYELSPNLDEVRTSYLIDALRRLGYERWPELLHRSLDQLSNNYYYISVHVEGLLKALPATSAAALRDRAARFKSKRPQLQLMELADEIEGRQSAGMKEELE